MYLDNIFVYHEALLSVVTSTSVKKSEKWGKIFSYIVSDTMNYYSFIGMFLA